MIRGNERRLAVFYEKRASARQLQIDLAKHYPQPSGWRECALTLRERLRYLRERGLRGIVEDLICPCE